MTQTINQPNEELNLEAQLAQFYGSDKYYRHWMRRLIYTEGVKFLAIQAGAYWLLDSIALAQSKCLQDPALQEFQIWRFKVENNAGVLTCERDTDDIFSTEKIAYTDFPLQEIKLYLENGVLCLPSER